MVVRIPDLDGERKKYIYPFYYKIFFFWAILGLAHFSKASLMFMLVDKT